MPGDVAAERSTGAGALRDIRSAQERLDELQKGLVRDSPPPTTWSERIATLNFSRKASVEWQTWQVGNSDKRGTRYFYLVGLFCG